MRTALAPASTFTDAAGSNEEARAVIAWLDQGQGAMVNSLKPTGASADNTRASLTSTCPRERTASKLAFLLSPRSLGRSTCGADNEHSLCRKADSNNRC